MKYMVIMKDHSVFMTDWYTHENCWHDGILCVVDTLSDKVTFDGQEWTEAEYDHL